MRLLRTYSVCTSSSIFTMCPPPSFAYCSGLFVSGFESQKMVVCRIAQVKISKLSFSTFLRVVRVIPLKQLLFSRLTEECECQGVSMCVPREMIKEWFGYGNVQFIDHIEVYQILAFIAMSRLSEVERDFLDHTTSFQRSIRLESCLVLVAQRIWFASWRILATRRLPGQNRLVPSTLKSLPCVVFRSTSPKQHGFNAWIKRWITYLFRHSRHKTSYWNGDLVLPRLSCMKIKCLRLHLQSRKLWGWRGWLVPGRLCRYGKRWACRCKEMLTCLQEICCAMNRKVARTLCRGVQAGYRVDKPGGFCRYRSITQTGFHEKYSGYCVGWSTEGPWSVGSAAVEPWYVWAAFIRDLTRCSGAKTKSLKLGANSRRKLSRLLIVRK